MDVIDAVDYGILTCVTEYEKGVWKKRAHEWLQQHADELPEQPSVSLQTVGRRINQLTDDDLLETEITSSPEAGRDLLITYQLTDEGRSVLVRKRQEFLQEYIKKGCRRFLLGDNDVELEDAVILRLLCDEFDVDDTVRDTLFPQCDPEELMALLYAHYVLANIDNVIQPENEPVLTEILQLTPALRAPFEDETFIYRMERRLSDPETLLAKTSLSEQPSPVTSSTSPHRGNQERTRPRESSRKKRWHTP